jgi:hypothetical protein
MITVRSVKKFAHSGQPCRVPCRICPLMSWLHPGLSSVNPSRSLEIDCTEHREIASRHPFEVSSQGVLLPDTIPVLWMPFMWGFASFPPPMEPNASDQGKCNVYTISVVSQNGTVQAPWSPLHAVTRLRPE